MIPSRLTEAGRVLILGGARSGKSGLAERLLVDEPAVEYVATSIGNVADAEWQERIERHRARRPAHWRTTETLDLAGLLDADGPPLLIDCLTVWLTRVMDRHEAWADANWEAAESKVVGEIAALTTALTTTSRRVVIVSNEVGQGIVPATSAGRRFRDQMGAANQRAAGVVDEVVWASAGRFTFLEEW